MQTRPLNSIVYLAIIVTCLLFGQLAAAQSVPLQHNQESEEPVGPTGPNRSVTPVHQILTPTGKQVVLPYMRPQVLALSPNGRLLVTSGKTHELVVLNPDDGTVTQRVALPAEKTSTLKDKIKRILGTDKKGQVSFTGLVFSPNGSRIYLSNVNGDIKVFSIDEAGHVEGLSSMSLPEANAPRRKDAIPAGLAISDDGKRLYVALNLSNRLAEIAAASGEVLRMWDVGVAPYDVVLLGKKAYVSNWGGRRPDKDSVKGPAGLGTEVRVDPVRFIANEGSVSIIDLAGEKEIRELVVGLHASALAITPDKRYLAIACAASDYVRVLDTKTDELVETIWVKHSPAELFGASPNALAFDKTGKTLFVANGTQNAIAVLRFDPEDKESELLGLIPVGWFPGAIVCDTEKQRLLVANIKGNASTRKDSLKDKLEHRTHEYHGSISLMPIPSKKELIELTSQVLVNNRYPLLKKAMLKPRPNQPARPVPERVGEPSVFDHVVYIIKENRTYDQVLGDVTKGNGDKSLCIFGENVTPNQHKMVRDFVLLDNTYCSGIQSADGHQWTDTAFATDYMEKLFAGFSRSYPDGMDERGVDALAYAPSGFIWDNAIAHNKTLRVYGEFAMTDASWKDKTKKSRINFLDFYNDFQNQTNLIDIRSKPAIESLRPHIDTQTVGWDMRIPDVFRAAQFIKELRQYEKQGKYPNLVIICLPNDHASGTRFGAPTPAAQVADNDLAFGQIVEALSHSPFWKRMCIVAIEDDPQAGWDHVSGYRTTAYMVSPYTKRGEVIHTQYNQTSVLRTIELILGLPPMNQLDATATPMSNCFTATPNFTPFTALPNNVPLDQMNPDPKKLSEGLAKRHALASAELPLDQVDQCDEDLLNRILWHAMKGEKTPYPEWAVTSEDDD